MQITVNILSQKSIDKAVQRLTEYTEDLENKMDILAERIAKAGVLISKMRVVEFDAVYTGELLKSINYEKGAVVQCGSEWIIYTDCPWAKFVEFGTGIVGKQNSHPDTGIIGWKYDVNDHGESGWFYYRDGEWYWTKGMPSRPFMYETTMELMKIITKNAKEVFK